MKSKIFSIFFYCCSLYYLYQCVFCGSSKTDLNLAISFTILAMITDGFKVVVKGK